METTVAEYTRHTMTNEDFSIISSFVNQELGIKMPVQKKIMLQCRLQKRVTDLKLNSFKEYIDYTFSNEGRIEEIIKMIDLVTTNKTDFFREPSHFDYLTETALPSICSASNAPKTIKIWSSACSSGEEPYTLAIVLMEFLKDYPEISFEITGTDISKSILQRAITAVYSEERVSGISLDIKKKYFLKSKDKYDRTVRLIPEIRSRVRFQRLNLMDSCYDIDKQFDIIFCRNVLIYFDRETQQKVINKLSEKLKPNGLFFLGHSESVTNMQVPLIQIKPTIFRKKPI